MEETMTARGAAERLAHLREGASTGRPWHYDLLQAVHQNHWNASNQQDLGQFITALEKGAEVDREAWFGQAIIALLDFPGLPDRHGAIPFAHQRTFEWVYEDASAFPKWLLQDQTSSLFWITGKPGSGKSTLMKFLYNDPRTLRYLSQWAGSNPLIRAGFFFWNSGTIHQMSQKGLLQSLLLQILQGYPEYKQLFPSRWKQYNLHGSILYDWTVAELGEALEMILARSPCRFAFFLDGLDEFDGDPQVLVDFVGRMTTRDTIKVCVASRPWNLFQDAFNQFPGLALERLTNKDIKLYVSDHLLNNQRFVKLLDREPHRAQNLVAEVVDKAFGVFLWVYLVVQSLLEGIRNGDSMADLESRLRALPSDLEELFDKLLKSVDGFYFQPACHLLQLVRRAYEPLDLISFYYTDDAADNAVARPINPLERRQLDDLEEEARRRLNSRCKGFLESPKWGDGKIRYLHRTAKDFLHSAHMWARIEAGTSPQFNANRTLALAHLCRMKTMSLKLTTWDEIWHPVVGCMEHSVQATMPRTKDDDEWLVALLLQLDIATNAVVINPDKQGPVTDKTDIWAQKLGCADPVYTFLDLCVRLNIVPFVRHSLETRIQTKAIDRKGYIHMLEIALTSCHLPDAFKSANALYQSAANRVDTVALILELCPNREWIVDAVRRVLSRSSVSLSADTKGILRDYCKRSRGFQSWVQRQEWFQRSQPKAKGP
jgi:hypothetical protein